MNVRRFVAASVLPILVLFGFGLLSVGFYMTRAAVEPVETLVNAQIVDVAVVVPQAWRPVVPLYGFLESPRDSQLTAGVTADVLKVLVSEGDFVTQGELLVQLDDADLALVVQDRKADLNEAEATIRSEWRRYENDRKSSQNEEKLLEIAKQNLARAQELFTKKLGSEAALEDARRNVEQQSLALNARQLSIEDHEARMARLNAQKDRIKVALARAERDFARTRVEAPFDGRLASVSVSVGQRVQIGMPVVKLFDYKAMEVRAQIPATHLQDVRDMLKAEQSLVAQGETDGTPIKLQLKRLSGSSTRGTGGVFALFEVIEGQDQLVLGRFVSFSLSLEAVENAIALPFESIYGTRRIYKIVDDRLQGLTIERLGEAQSSAGESRVLIASSDIQSGDRILVSQLPNAVDGLLVAPQTRPLNP